jgi:hypothetical protein
MGAYNRFAAQDASLRRQNIQYADQFSRERQRRADMQTQADMAQYDREQQATGQAISSGLTGMAGAANFSQAMGFYKDLYGGSGGAGGGAAAAGGGVSGGSSMFELPPPNFGGIGFKNIYSGGIKFPAE